MRKASETPAMGEAKTNKYLYVVHRLKNKHLIEYSRKWNMCHQFVLTKT